MESEGFERVVTEQKDRLFSYARMMLGNAAEAQDVAQESLIRLWRHRERVELGGAAMWLRRTAHNLCVDHMRRRRVRAESPETDSGPRLVGDDPGPERLARSAELGSQIERALAGMAERDRAVLVLREVQGLAYSEIAELLGVPLGTLKARLHRARELLRDRLTRAGVSP